jgi:hypothetical protein
MQIPSMSATVSPLRAARLELRSSNTTRLRSSKLCYKTS